MKGRIAVVVAEIEARHIGGGRGCPDGTSLVGSKCRVVEGWEALSGSIVKKGCVVMCL